MVPRTIVAGRSGGYDTLAQVKILEGRVVAVRGDTLDLSVQSAFSAGGDKLPLALGARVQVVPDSGSRVSRKSNKGSGLERKLAVVLVSVGVAVGLWLLLAVPRD
jgi:hypothetical protein